MINRILFALFVCISTFANAQDTPDFIQLLVDNQLQFDMPEGFGETEIKENRDLYYNYAIKSENSSFEVRYTIFSLKPLLKEYEESLTDSTKTMLAPNSYHKSMYMANILNVSQAGMENMPGSTPFPSEAVKTEFGADYGATAFFPANSEFAKDHEFCMMILLHKDDVADVFISILANTPEEIEENLMTVFHACRFK